MNILIVDDQPLNQKLLQATLEAEGHQVTRAADGMEALSSLEDHAADAIISDILMPNMDGYRLCLEVRKSEKLKNLPFVHYTATYTSPNDEKLSRDVGADSFLRKPALAKEIISALCRAGAKEGWTSKACILPEADLLKEYNARLVAKMEQKVEELEAVTGLLEAEIDEHMRMEEVLRATQEEARLAKEVAERANGAKDSFLASLSHELRTPLTPVLLCATALEHEPAIAPEFRQQLSMMRQNIELEARLIDDLLDATLIAHGKFRVTVAGAIDIHSLLVHTEQIVRGDALAKSIQIDLILEATEHHVAGDAARLHQVFWNILKNAIKFTMPGGLITVRTANPRTGEFVLTMADDGVGINEQTLPIIFEAFEQGNRGSSRPFGGLGIGLTLSKAIVELHDGVISAQSAGPGHGAIFTVKFNTVNPPIVIEELATPLPPAKVELQRLLLVEDHEPTLTVLAGLLRGRGHTVSTANSVNSALLLASSQTVDFVISDLGLPDGDGEDLMRQLASDYGLRGIALSGYGMEQDFVRTHQAGFCAHLVKPVNFEELEATLQQFAGVAPQASRRLTESVPYSCKSQGIRAYPR